MLRLIHGDCLEKMKDISSCSVDLILCDLPYGCLADNRKKKPNIRRADNGKPLPRMNERITGCTWDTPIDLAAFWEQVRRIRKNDHTPTIHFCTTKFGYDLIKSNEREFRYDLVWSKSNAVGFLSANKKPMSSHEMMYVFSKAGATYERIDISGDFPPGGGGRSSVNFLPIAGMPNTGTTVAGKRCVKSVVEMANKKKKGAHPTQKPHDLYKWLIERYCPPGGTVLDPTFGSGTSMEAAVALGRRAVGIEKDKTFFDKAVARLSPPAVDGDNHRGEQEV
jgi:site-specific DNA-methyltransferase (adenine-specific)